MERLARDKAKREFYKVLYAYLSCLDSYFSIEHPKHTHTKNITQKFIVTARHLQSIIQSLETE